MERQNFEGSWKEAFDQAEIGPSDNVWTNIELDLERRETGKIKRRLLFYKMLAAASVFVGMCIGGTGIYILNDQRNMHAVASVNQMPMPGQQQSADVRSMEEQSAGVIPSQQQNLVSDNTNQSSNLSYDKKSTTEINSSSSSIDKVKSKGVDRGVQDNAGALQPAILLVSESEDLHVNDEVIPVSILENGRIAPDEDFVAMDSRFSDRKLPALTNTRDIKLSVSAPEKPEPVATEPDAGEILLASLQVEELEEKKEKSSREKFWTSLGVAAGPFNSVNSSVNTDNTFAANQAGLADASAPVNNTLRNETKASGVAYSLGFQLGGKVAERWVVQGGVNYLNQSSAFISNVVVENQVGTFVAGNSREITRQASGETKVYSTASHTVNNSMQFVSLPVQAGFLLVDKAFGVQLNGGVSTDVFLQNTINSPGQGLEKVTEESGAESPYRPINFSGLFNTEFSYRFAEKYRIALSPGLRYPLNSIYKTNTGLESVPLTFDIGLKFRYIFN